MRIAGCGFGIDNYCGFVDSLGVLVLGRQWDGETWGQGEWGIFRVAGYGFWIDLDLCFSGVTMGQWDKGTGGVGEFFGLRS